MTSDAETEGRREDLLAVAEELAAQDERPARAREATVRRPRRTIRGRTRDGAVIEDPDGSDVREERVRVRSLADEPGSIGARPPVDPAERSADPVPDVGPIMLDAQGNEIAVDPSTPGVGPVAVEHSDAAVPRNDAALITVGVFLADAVRSYLDGLEQLGADHPVTVDRLAQLRRTLERFDVELDA
jgi:hypothetical protein